MLRNVVFVFLTCIIISGCKEKVDKGKETQELALQMLDGTTRLFEGVWSWHAEDTAVIADSSYQVRDYKITFTRLGENRMDIDDSAKNISGLEGYGGTYMGNSDAQVTEEVSFYLLMRGGRINEEVRMVFNTRTNKVQSLTYDKSVSFGAVGWSWEKLELKEQ